MQDSEIQQVIDRISYTVESSFLDSEGNLKGIEEFRSDKNGKLYLFVYFSTVTLDTINAINEELGTSINTIFPNTEYGIEVNLEVGKVLKR